MAKKDKIINAHTHTFTGNFVPPYLAKTIVPWPLYYLIHTGWIIGLFKFYYKLKHRKEYAIGDTEEERDKLWQKIYRRRQKERRKVKFDFNIRSRWYLYIPIQLIFILLSVIAALYCIDFLSEVLELSKSTKETVHRIEDNLQSVYLYFKIPTVLKVVWVILALILIPFSRRFILVILKTIFPFVKKLVGGNTLALLERYLLMGRFTFYGTQRKIARRALDQLPEESAIVILPMDMEYMGAGKTKMTRTLLKDKAKKLEKGWSKDDFKDVFKYQMRELWDVVKNKNDDAPKNQYYPFLFIDPRRYEDEGTSYFDYHIKGNKMVLNPCFVKTYMEDRNFSGFKIYPALGYYPFDERLLPIWRYAAENNVPIMSHCIIGTIYYRGKKESDWNFHEIFKTAYEEDVYEPMVLPQTKNVDMQFNFTHPLNYICLLEKDLLTTVVKQAKSDSVRTLFGYDEKTHTIAHDLSNLKVCLAHFGGEVEWNRYLEQDRQVYSQRLMRDPKNAIKFMKNSRGEFSWDKLSQLWENADWYSLICSLLINYDNMYADLSYIISKPSIYPLLKYSLEKGENYHSEHTAYLAEPSQNRKSVHYTGKNRLRSRILFGTDFYVVRNHNSDKDLFMEANAALDEESFDLIARENTKNYLSRN